MVRETPERVRPITFCYPVYSDSQYAPWQLTAAFCLLHLLNRRGTPLGFRMMERDEACATPLLQWVRTPDNLKKVVLHHQYQFDWPERVVVDTVLDAERLGATVRNYTRVCGLRPAAPSGWELLLREAVVSESGSAEVWVEAAVVINAAGVWIDQVNTLAKAGAKRRVTGTKGIHIAVQLPRECRDYAVVSLNRHNEQIYCVPWRGLHYIGPTETLFEGDPDDVRPTEPEIEWLLDEFNYLVPGAKLKRQDVLYAWAGVRPLTYDPSLPKGNRARTIHDQADDAMPDMISVTAGPIMSHRATGRALCQAVRSRIPPSDPPSVPNFATCFRHDDQGSPGITNAQPEVSVAQLRHAAAQEHVVTLADLLFRRVGVGWSSGLGRESALAAANAVADVMDWDQGRITQELSEYETQLRNYHLAPGR